MFSKGSLETAEKEPIALDQEPPGTDEDVFTSKWIVTQVLNSGADGISPPEILQKAKAAAVKMHPNYPYVVLRKAVERGEITKFGSRYLKKE
jgi:hypothetical protein